MANTINLPNFHVDTDAAVVTGRGWLTELTIRNNAAAAGVLSVYDATTATGIKLVDAEVGGNTSLHLYFGPGIQGKKFDTGLYFDVAASMTVTGHLA